MSKIPQCIPTYCDYSLSGELCPQLYIRLGFLNNAPAGDVTYEIQKVYVYRCLVVRAELFLRSVGGPRSQTRGPVLATYQTFDINVLRSLARALRGQFRLKCLATAPG